MAAPIVAVASDHAGLNLRREIARVLAQRGFAAIDLGPETADRVDYPDFAEKVCAELAAGRAGIGILVCGTGLGMCIAANKHRGVRAVVCHTEYEARMARAHNDANVLCLGERTLGPGLAASIVAAFLEEKFEGGRHQARVDRLNAL